MVALTGKVALVTGASRGIGRASALALAEAGAKVIVHYGHKGGEAAAVVEQIRLEGGRADAVGGDLASPDGPHRIAADVRQLVGDHLDILVANAGMGKERTSIEDTSIEDFDRLYAINVRAPFFLVQQLLPSMGAGASIILLSSLAAHAAVGALPAYAGTKGAIETFVKHFASALGPRGIRVNAVAPGVIETDMTDVLFRDDGGSDRVVAMQALKRVGQPADIADVVVFLAADAARWITGDTIRVDGGSKL